MDSKRGSNAQRGPWHRFPGERLIFAAARLPQFRIRVLHGLVGWIAADFAKLPT
jgi:hypothetical protein